VQPAGLLTIDFGSERAGIHSKQEPHFPRNGVTCLPGCQGRGEFTENSQAVPRGMRMD
jgi:hypothetical protein